MTCTMQMKVSAAFHLFLFQHIPTDVSSHSMASACKNERCASSIVSCRRLPVFGSRRTPAYHIPYEYSRWSSCEVAVSSCLFDLTCNESTSHFHSFAVTIVGVSPSTGDRFASCPHHARFVRHFFVGFEVVIPRHFLHACLSHLSRKTVTLFTSSAWSPSQSFATYCTSHFIIPSVHNSSRSGHTPRFNPMFLLCLNV